MSCKIEILLTADKYVLRVEILQISLTSRNITGKNHHQLPEAITRGFSGKRMFLKIPQNSQENTCSRASFLINLQASAL